MKNKIFSIVALLSCAALLTVSCNDMKEISERVDGLENRVETLETLCGTLNGQVAALQTFVENNKSISSFTQAADGTYTLTLSDNSTIVLKQGSEGAAVMPEIAVNNDGNWTVNGVVLKVGDNPVPATGENGATPIFGVDAEGYWTVKYAAEDTPARVLDVNGQPVKATPAGVVPGESNDSFFSSVVADGDKVTVTLKADGKSYSLPVIPDFVCAIKGAEGQPVVFKAGETKSYTVEQKNVVSAVIFKPAGWEASLEESMLNITAPAAVVKAVADTRQDVSILAISASGFAAVAKIKVQLDDAPIVVTPTAAVTAGEATQNSLTFTVNLSNASEWYYTLLKSTEAAPTAEALKAATKGGESTTLTLTADASGAELTPETAYTLYVLPVNATAEGSIASAEKATLEKVYASLYEKYNEGGDIEIAGVKYNKAAYGEATLLKAENEEVNLRDKIHQKTGVFFLESTGTGKFITPSIVEIKDKVVLIGNNAGTLTTVKPSMNWKLIAGELVMNNIEFDMTNLNAGVTNGTYGFNNANATADFEKLHFDNCKITDEKVALLYISNAANMIKSIRFCNGMVQMTATAANNIFMNLYKTTKLDVSNEIVFANNIVYSATPIAFQLISYDQTVTQSGTTWNGTLDITNNTFYNVPSKNGYVKFYQFAEIDYSRNIYYADASYNASASYMIIIYSENQTGDNCRFDDNIAFGMAADKNWDIAHSNSKYKPTPNRLTKLGSTPFQTADVTTGTFTPVAAYATYGAQR